MHLVFPIAFLENKKTNNLFSAFTVDLKNDNYMFEFYKILLEYDVKKIFEHVL